MFMKEIMGTSHMEDIAEMNIRQLAEDQLMSAETFRVMAEEFIEVYKKITA